MVGKDARRGFERAGDEMVDRYATDIFTDEANKVIELCKNQGKPMFLMVSHLAVHTGVPGPDILEVSNKTHNDIRFNYIENKERRLYAGKNKLTKFFEILMLQNKSINCRTQFKIIFTIPA